MKSEASGSVFVQNLFQLFQLLVKVLNRLILANYVRVELHQTFSQLHASGSRDAFGPFLIDVVFEAQLVQLV